MNCPNGHEVADDAVVCSQCWNRIEGATRKRRRLRSGEPLSTGAVIATTTAIAFALIVAAVGVIGLVSGSFSSTQPAVVAEAGAAGAQESPFITKAQPTTGPVSVAVPQAATVQDEPVSVAVPQAATVATSFTGCDVAITKVPLKCSYTTENLVFELCVWRTVDSVVVESRPLDKSEPWTKVTDGQISRDSQACAEAGSPDLASASISLVKPDLQSFKYRIIANNADGERSWKAPIMIDLGGDGDQGVVYVTAAAE